ncbi:MucBP domain-containing protein [Secundilactobacillus kimchicus]|uniref:MucBP domain-containing protein n=1 Tax=Secundilactobacillus kimchicus TaxID=528209 RepID=UPI0024A8C7B0|nr:MucBP domain-containing protein [Secundilactobacillus kimchicus]
MWGFRDNTATVSAQLEENGDISLKNPLFIFDDQGNRVSLKEGITVNNNGLFDGVANEMVWHHADLRAALTVNWSKQLLDPSPFNFDSAKPVNLNFSGVLNVRVLGRPVIVKYVDEKDHEIADSKTITGYFGDAYQTEKRSIFGYTYESVDGPESGVLGSHTVTVTYHYKKQTDPTTPPTLSVPTTPTNPTEPSQPVQHVQPALPRHVAVKGQAIYAIRTVGLYRSRQFSDRTRIKFYPKAKRISRPEFVVKGYQRDNKGRLRYLVQQYSPYTTRYIKGTTGYLTASSKYVIPAYYATLPKSRRIRVINPTGIYEYKQYALKGKGQLIKVGKTLRVTRIRQYKYATRYQLENGHYVTANKKFIIFTR